MINWFIFAAGFLYIGGALLEVFKGHWSFVALYLAYATANFILSVQ
jgi:hypothetical protein